MSKKNEELHKMRAQILNLRSAGFACATAIHRFPPCGRPGGDHRQCPEARAVMLQIYEEMQALLLSSRLALSAVFHSDSEAWDFLSWLSQNGAGAQSDMAKFGEAAYSDQDEFIRIWGAMDCETTRTLGSDFSDTEWEALTAEDAWQNGRRLSQIFHLLRYLEDQIAKQFDLFDSVLCSGLLGDCNLGRWAANKESIFA